MTKLIEKSPRELGYFMPAEWESHEGTWLQWPQDKLYHGYELKLERIWLNMVEALREHENVHLIVSGEQRQDHIVNQLDSYCHRVFQIKSRFHIRPVLANCPKGSCGCQCLFSGCGQPGGFRGRSFGRTTSIPWK